MSEVSKKVQILSSTGFRRSDSTKYLSIRIPFHYNRNSPTTVTVKIAVVVSPIRLRVMITYSTHYDTWSVSSLITNLNDSQYYDPNST